MRNTTIAYRAGLLAAAIAMTASAWVRAAEPARQAAAPAAAQPAAVRPLLDKYCVGCHSDRMKTGGLTLQTIDVQNVHAGAETWEKVIRKLRTGTMPPAGMPRPDAATIAGLASHLETKVDEGAAASPNPGRAPIHRLNRVEYTNAIRDLLALEIDGKSMLPADAAGHGFDNLADALSLTPGLLERYLLVAQTISRLAVADPTMRPSASVYSLPFTMLQADRMGDDMPFGSRGGLSVRHYFPLDGEYTLQIRLQRHAVSVGHDIRGLDELNEIDVRVDGARVKLFTIGGQAAEQDGDQRGPDRGTPLERSGDDSLVFRFPVKAGNRLVSVVFRKNTWMQEGVGVSRLPVASYGFASGRRSSTDYGKIEAGIENVEIAGPYGGAPSETESRARIFICRPAAERDEAPCAEKILSTIAKRAYRRPASKADVDTLMTFYREGRTGATFDAGIQAALERVLVDPEFLFRAEIAPAKTAAGALYRINDLELASRLSFFLWSSLPDDQLIDLAARGRLKDAAVLEQQVKRMIADPRAKALTANFFGQWLWTRNISATAPDPKAFPEFDENLRLAFQRETELFLESQLVENRSVLDLLTGNYTFVNERLAKHYGIPNVYGPHFRRVTLPDDRRAGLLGQGSVLTVTSYPNRTSPVVRGKWLLENFLGVPPPEPPPDVPPFPEEEGLTVTRSVRERLEQHRKNPTCAACHNQMDPLGFALENFDAIGKWRVSEAKLPINASGTLPNGVKFNGPAEFRNALMNHRDAFVKTLTEKLLTYAMGRGVEYYDLPAVRQIMRESAAQDYRWSTLVLSIVKSMPFQMRRSQS